VLLAQQLANSPTPPRRLLGAPKRHLSAWFPQLEAIEIAGFGIRQQYQAGLAYYKMSNLITKGSRRNSAQSNLSLKGAKNGRRLGHRRESIHGKETVRALRSRERIDRRLYTRSRIDLRHHDLTDKISSRDKDAMRFQLQRALCKRGLWEGCQRKAASEKHHNDGDK